MINLFKRIRRLFKRKSEYVCDRGIEIDIGPVGGYVTINDKGHIGERYFAESVRFAASHDVKPPCDIKLTDEQKARIDRYIRDCHERMLQEAIKGKPFSPLKTDI